VLFCYDYVDKVLDKFAGLTPANKVKIDDRFLCSAWGMKTKCEFHQFELILSLEVGRNHVVQLVQVTFH
jgi:hypothetical protein